MRETPQPPARTERPEVHPSRWKLIRDVAAFQLKLFLDGVRDVLLMPISLGLAALDLLGVGPRPGRHFYDLLRVGRRTESWINLFGADREIEALEGDSREGIDSLVDRMERLVVREYERGGITTSAKNAVDRALDGLTKDGRSGGPPPA